MELKKIVPNPKTYFLKVKCSSCGNEQVIFSNPSSKVKCLVCEHILAETSSAKLDLKSKVVKKLE